MIQQTSIEAYASIDKATVEARVLSYLQECGARGSTDDEGWRALGMLKDTYAPRRTKLVAKGLVENAGTRRPTAAGRSAIVWRIRGELAAVVG